MVSLRDMNKKRITLLLVIANVLVACASQRPLFTSRSQLVQVHCGRLIDGVHDEIFTNVDLIVENGRITKIGPDLPQTDGAQIVDWSKYTVLPGLIDMHTHLTLAPEDEADIKKHFLTSRSTLLERARVHAHATLAAGFTSVRDVGTYLSFANTQLRDEISSGKVLGPRIQAAPFYLTIPHGGGDSFVPGEENLALPKGLRDGVARGAKDFATKAQAAIDGGGDVLKVIASGAMLAPGGVPGKSEMTRAEIAAVVKVAHQAGLRVAAHAHGTQSIKDAILAGADTIEHASLIDEEGLQLAKRHRTPLVMDIYDGDYIDEEGTRLNWPKDYLKQNRNLTEIQRQTFTKSLKAGVTILFGTDAGVYPHGMNAKQFKIMVERGMTPMQAIQSATSKAAAFLDWGKDVGSVQPGHFADLIAVVGDPLNDMTELERVRGVMKSGVLVKPAP